MAEIEAGEDKELKSSVPGKIIGCGSHTSATWSWGTALGKKDMIQEGRMVSSPALL
jgi:hypothetical protein